MKIQNAIEVLEDMISEGRVVGDKIYPLDEEGALKAAISALEKQESKKAKSEGICPHCLSFNKVWEHIKVPADHKIVYCWNCGQAVTTEKL